MSAVLESLVEELRDSDHQERMILLAEMASKLPPLPERFEAMRDDAHRVPECIAQVFVFIELEGDRARIYADVPEQAPSTRGFLAMLVEGLDGRPYREVLELGDDILDRSGLRGSIGMQRLGGMYAILRRLRRGVAAQVAAREETPS